MLLDFIQIWVIALVSIAVTSFVAILFVLIVTGIVEDMDPNEKGELQSFSVIVLGTWSIGASLLVAQVIFLLS